MKELNKQINNILSMGGSKEQKIEAIVLAIDKCISSVCLKKNES